MKKPNIIRTIIIIVVIIILGAVFYTIFFKSSSSTNTSSGVVSTDQNAPADTANLPPDQAAASQEFLNTLLNLKSIKLDDSLFSSPTYLSLQDFSVILLPPTNPGRPNPFAPIGSDSSSTLPTVAQNVITLSASNITLTTALLSGQVATTITPSERWFEWGTIATPSVRTANIVSASAPFSSVLSGLSPNTTYYYKAAVAVGTVVYYGPVVSFQTLANGSVSSGPAAQ